MVPKGETERNIQEDYKNFNSKMLICFSFFEPVLKGVMFLIQEK